MDVPFLGADALGHNKRPSGRSARRVVTRASATWRRSARNRTPSGGRRVAPVSNNGPATSSVGRAVDTTPRSRGAGDARRTPAPNARNRVPTPAPTSCTRPDAPARRPAPSASSGPRCTPDSSPRSVARRALLGPGRRENAYATWRFTPRTVVGSRHNRRPVSGARWHRQVSLSAPILNRGCTTGHAGGTQCDQV